MPVGWGRNLQGEILDAEMPEAGQHHCGEHQETRLSAPPAEDRALSIRAVPQLDEGPVHPPVLVAPVPESDWGAPLKGVPRVEHPAEDLVDGGEEGCWNTWIDKR